MQRTNIPEFLTSHNILHGYCFKQHHASTVIWYKRYFVLYKTFLFYWENHSDCFSNIEFVFSALSNTTLPHIRSLLSLFDSYEMDIATNPANKQIMDIEHYYNGNMTSSDANNILLKSTKFRGLYILHGYDITRSSYYLKTSISNNKIKVIDKIASETSTIHDIQHNTHAFEKGEDTKGKKAGDLSLPIYGAATGYDIPPNPDQPNFYTLHPISFPTITKNQFRVINIAFYTELQREYWVQQLQLCSAHLITPRLTPFLQNLTLPSKFTFGDLHVQFDLKTYLSSNRFTLFDVNELLLGYYYTGSLGGKHSTQVTTSTITNTSSSASATSSGLLPPLHDIYTHCILFTTHRILKIQNNQVTLNFPYAEIDTVLFYSHAITDTRRSLGLVNSVRYVCNTSSTQHNNDTIFLISALKGLSKNVKIGANSLYSSFNPWFSASSSQQQQQKSRSNQNDSSPKPPQSPLAAASRIRTGHSSHGSTMPFNFWFLDESTIPEVTTMSKKTFVLLQLTNGKRTSVELTKNKKDDIFFANLLSRILVIRRLLSVSKERYAAGVYNTTLRLWSWTLQRYVNILQNQVIVHSASSQPVPGQSNSNGDNSPFIKSQTQIAPLLVNIPPIEILKPELVTGYIDFTGGATKLSQNIINIAYHNIFQRYYKDGVLNTNKPDDIFLLNKTLQCVNALEEFYRSDVNYIVAGDHGMLVLDSKPVNNIFHDNKLMDIPALQHKKQISTTSSLHSSISSSSSSPIHQQPFYLPFALDDKGSATGEMEAQRSIEEHQIRMLRQQLSQRSLLALDTTGNKSEPSKSNNALSMPKFRRMDSKKQLHKRKKRSVLSLDRAHTDDNDVQTDAVDDSDDEVIMGGFATKSSALKTKKLPNDKEKVPSTLLTKGTKVTQSIDHNDLLTLSLADGNGALSKYTPGYQYEYILSDFTGSTTQQWKWNDDDLLWPYHSTFTPAYFEQPQLLQQQAKTKQAEDEKLKNVLKDASSNGKHRIGDIMTDEVWQNQRFYPFYRWSSNLLPTDRPAWSTDSGQPRTVNDANRDLPEGWEWVEPNWYKDISSATSSEGWLYSTELTNGVANCEARCSSNVHVVRKRRWIRRRKLVEIPEESEEDNKDKKKMKFGGEDSEGAQDDGPIDDEYLGQQDQLRREYETAMTLQEMNNENLDDKIDEMMALCNYTESQFATNKVTDGKRIDDQQKQSQYTAAAGVDGRGTNNKLIKNDDFKEKSKAIAIQRKMVQRGLQNGYGVLMEFLYENQVWQFGKGWVDRLYPVTTPSPPIIQKQYPARIPRNKKGEEVGKWSSDDWSVILSDNHFVLPGFGFKWTSAWQIDICVDGDDGYWQYSRSSVEPGDGDSSSSASWTNSGKFGVHYRRRRWVRYKEIVIDESFVPKYIHPMKIRYEENDTITFVYDNDVHRDHQQEGEKKGKKNSPLSPKSMGDWEKVENDTTVDEDTYLLTIKGLFNEYGIASQSPGLQHLDSGSLVVLQSQSQQDLQKDNEARLMRQNEKKQAVGNASAFDDGLSEEDQEEFDLHQKWSVLGVDSLYLDRYIIPLIHQCDIAREENKAIFSIMDVYKVQSNSAVAVDDFYGNNYKSILSGGLEAIPTGLTSPSAYPMINKQHNQDSSPQNEEQIQLFKTLGYKTLNEEANLDEQDILTQQVHSGSSDISYYNRNKHYLSNNFTPYRAVPNHMTTLNEFASAGPESSSVDSPAGSIINNNVVITSRSYINYIKCAIASIPSGHLSALLQLWLEQSRSACTHHNVSWTNRVPPPLLYCSFKNVMQHKLIDMNHPIPPIPFVSSYCYHHHLIWSNTYFSIYMPKLPHTKISKSLNDVSASYDQYISLGDTIINNGNEVRSLVYKDHPLFLPPTTFRLIHVLVDNQTISIRTPEQQQQFETDAAIATKKQQVLQSSAALNNSPLPLLIYEMIPPVGYIALGLVARTSRPTHTHLYRVIPQEFVSIPTEHRQDELALSLSCPEPVAPGASNISSYCPPPTSIRMFSNVDGFTRGERIGHVITGFESSAKQFTELLMNDQQYESIVKTKQQNKLDLTSAQFHLESKSKVAQIHPWALRDIKADEVDLIDEAIANGVLAEAFRDIAQFATPQARKDHDQRSVLQGVIDAVNHRRGAQSSSKIAFTALESHPDQNKLKQEHPPDSDEENSEADEAFLATLIRPKPGERPLLYPQTAPALKDKLGSNTPETLVEINAYPTKDNREMWNTITNSNTKYNCSIKRKPKEINGFIAPSKEQRMVLQHKDYYNAQRKERKRKQNKKQQGNTNTSGDNNCNSFGVRFNVDEDGQILPTYVRVKTQEEEDIDAAVPNLSMKQNKSPKKAEGPECTPLSKPFPLSPRSLDIFDMSSASMAGKIFEKKIEKVTYPTITLPYFRSNNLPLLPSLKYVHSSIEELTMAQQGMEDGEGLDENGLPIDVLEGIPQETQSRRLTTYNSIIPRLTNGANTIALWNLPPNTFTLTTGQNEPINIRLGMSHIKPIATWCGELWMHSHTLEILLCGVITRRLHYRHKWDIYQQKLIELKKEEDLLKEKRARRKAKREKKLTGNFHDDTGVTVTEKDLVKDSIKARKLGHRLYAESSEDEQKDKKRKKDGKNSNKSDIANSGSDSDEDAHDFYERPIDMEEQEKIRQQEEKVKRDQEKFKRFYDSDDETFSSKKPHRDSDDDDDRFNFIGDDLALRKKFLFDSESSTEVEEDEEYNGTGDGTEEDLKSNKKDPANGKNGKEDKQNGKAKHSNQGKIRLDDIDGSDSDSTDATADVIAMTTGLFGESTTTKSKKSKTKKAKSKAAAKKAQEKGGSTAKSIPTDITTEESDEDFEDEDDENGDDHADIPSKSKSLTTTETSINAIPAAEAPKDDKQIIIPGVNINFDSLFNPTETDETGAAGNDDDLGENTQFGGKTILQPVKYDYLPPKKINQLLPPMISTAKHYALYIRQLVTQYNAIQTNKVFSLPNICMDCYKQYKKQQLDAFEGEIKKEQSQRSLWSSLSSANRKKYRESDNKRKKELQYRLHQFDEFERVHQQYLDDGVMMGNVCLNITPFNFEYIPLTSICTVLTAQLYIPCTCGNIQTPEYFHHANSQSSPIFAPTNNLMSSITENILLAPPKEETTVVVQANHATPPMSKKRGIYDELDNQEIASSPTLSTPVITPQGSPLPQVFGVQSHLPQFVFNFEQFSTLTSSAPPFLCPMTPYEHLACLLWLLQQTTRLCQQIRVSILEDLLFEGLQNTQATDRVGSLVSMLIKWESVLDYIPPLTYIDAYLCNQLLRKYNCNVPKRLDLIISQPYKTYIYTRCLDLVTHRFVVTISPALNAWDRVRNYIFTLPNTTGSSTLQNTSVSSPTASSDSNFVLGGTFKLKNQQYLENVNNGKDITKEHITSPLAPVSELAGVSDFNDIFSKETFAYDLITGQRLGDGGSDDDNDDIDNNAGNNAKENSTSRSATQINDDPNAHLNTGQSVSDADLAAEFAVDMGLTLVESNTQEQELLKLGTNVSGGTLEEQKQQVLQQLLIAMSSLTQDLLAVQRVGKKRLSIFKLFLFTYNDLFLQILNESLHVDILVLAEKASVGEWLDSYLQLLKSITTFITIDTMHQLSSHERLEMIQQGTFKQYLELCTLRPIINDLLNNIRLMRLNYINEYLNVVKTNINHMFENILMSETSLLPRYQPYDQLAQFTGHFETFSPTDVYEILQTFCNSMLKQFRLFPIFNQTISILTKADFLSALMNITVKTTNTISEVQGDLNETGQNELQQQIYKNNINKDVEHILYDFNTQYRIAINNTPVDYEVLQDKYLLITKLFDVLTFTQSYYFSALIIHLDRLFQRVIVNKGGLDDQFKQTFSLYEQEPKKKSLFGSSQQQQNLWNNKAALTVFKPQSFQSKRDQIISILDLPSASKLFTQSITDMQKFVDEHKIQVKKKQSIGSKQLVLQYIFSNTVNQRTASSKIASAITNTSTVSTIPLPHIYIIGHMNNVWDYLQHRNGLIERFQKIFSDINENINIFKMLSYVRKSIIQQQAPASIKLWTIMNKAVNKSNSTASQSISLDSLPSDPVSPTNNLIDAQSNNNDYISFIDYFNLLLEHESESIENAIYTIYYKSHDILISQCHFSIAQYTQRLFTNEWWTTQGTVSLWLEHIHFFIYNTFIGIHVDSNNVIYIKQYLRKIIKNISYMYLARFLASFYFDKKKADFIYNLQKGTKSNDYSFEILLDKMYNDISTIIAFCNKIEQYLPPNILYHYEKELHNNVSLSKVDIKVDTVLLAQFFTLCEYNSDEDIINNFDDLYANINGTKYITEYVVQSLYNKQCVITIGSLIHVIFTLKGGTITKDKVNNTLSTVIQLCNNKIKTSASLAKPSLQHQTSLSNKFFDDDDEVADNEYESIFKHSTLRLYVLVEYGRGLSAKNTDGMTSDPYVVVKCMQGRVGGSDTSKVMEKKSTRSITANINPDWYEFVSFSSQSLLFTDSIELHIYDNNWLSKDISMGSVRISRHSIEQRCIQMRKNIKDFKKFNQNASNSNSTPSAAATKVSSPGDNDGILGNDKFAIKRDEMLSELEKKTACSIWGYCTEKFSLTIPNRGSLTCTFVLLSEDSK